ncbi:MAG: Mut7-C RNAse domain-containing protein [bacterium]|nr:Mut7-C RNAse domain-containing protein [bacterium]
MPRLAADCMLGKLAKWLRILGFDTWYSNSWDEGELLAGARAEARVILTRDTRFFRRISDSDRAIFIENDSFWYQIREVISGLNFIPPAERFFTRCSLCNHPLLELPREEAQARVPEYVFRTQEHFAFCSRCGRTYWSGTHQKMAKEMLEEILFPSAPEQNLPR